MFKLWVVPSIGEEIRQVGRRDPTYKLIKYVWFRRGYHIYIYIYISISVCVCVFVRVCACVCIYIYIYMCVCVCMRGMYA